jgi:hypothetical protein
MTRESNPAKNESAFRDTESDAVVGRTPRGYLWLSFGILAFGVICMIALAFSTPNPKVSKLWVEIFILLLGSFPCGLGLLSAWAIVRTRVVADESGLRWRGMGAWKRATWTQVQDYYIKALPKGSKSYVVETTVGKLDLKDLTHGTLLRQIIRERARWAKVDSWQIRSKNNETLELSASETFEADQSFTRFFGIILLIVVFVLPLLMTIGAGPGLSGPLTVYRSIERTWQTLGPLWAFGTVAVLFFPGLIYGLMLFAQWPVVRAMQQRKNQSITVSPYGLKWSNSTTGQEISVRWEEVHDFYVDELPGWVRTAARAVIETTRGDFDFVVLNSSGKRTSTRLQALIQKYCAKHGLQQEWERKSTREPSAPSSSAGATKIYTYRNSPVRVMLPFFTFLALMMWITMTLRYIGFTPKATPHDPADLAMGLFFSIPLTIGSVWMWWQYFCFMICVDERGLTQRCNGRTRFIAWPQVREYENVGGCSIVHGDKETIRFYSALGNYSELQKIIATHATHSLTKTW